MADYKLVKAINNGNEYCFPGGGASYAYADVLIIGGGGGGWRRNTGGGAGAAILGPQIIPIGKLCITIGSGGGANTNGTATCFGPLIALGGCAGKDGAGGNSGGGYTGGSGYGGGAGSRGNGCCGYPGVGGIGVMTDITGTMACYAGGGGGTDGQSGAGGCYGGGGGGTCWAKGGNGSTCGSGGGAGCTYPNGCYGGTGANGLVVVRYKTDGSYGINCATGGCKYTCGDYTIHCFTSDDTFCILG